MNNPYPPPGGPYGQPGADAPTQLENGGGYPPPTPQGYPPPQADPAAYGQPAANPYAAPPAFAPAVPAYGGGFGNPYDEYADLSQMFDANQREQFKRHGLTSFPTWAAVLLHFLTLGLFTIIYQGLKFEKLPRVKGDDFGAGPGIGFLFIPFFNLYWMFRYWLGLTDRINFQYRLRGQAPPISRGLALTTAIISVIPYVNLLGYVTIVPIMTGIVQSATNGLAQENEGFGQPAYQQY